MLNLDYSQINPETCLELFDANLVLQLVLSNQSNLSHGLLSKHCGPSIFIAGLFLLFGNADNFSWIVRPDI